VRAEPGGRGAKRSMQVTALRLKLSKKVRHQVISSVKTHSMFSPENNEVLKACSFQPCCHVGDDVWVSTKGEHGELMRYAFNVESDLAFTIVTML